MVPKMYTMGGILQVLIGQSFVVRIFCGAPSVFLLEPKGKHFLHHM